MTAQYEKQTGHAGTLKHLEGSLNLGSILAYVVPIICCEQGRNYDFWLGSAAKFPLSENSDKTLLTEAAKNRAVPLFMAAAAEADLPFFRHLWRLGTDG